MSQETTESPSFDQIVKGNVSIKKLSMETEDDHIYAFVIHKACLNSHDQVVFTVSTKEISLQNNTSKKLVQLPCGKCNNVRFDIDDLGNPASWIGSIFG